MESAFRFALVRTPLPGLLRKVAVWAALMMTFGLTGPLTGRALAVGLLVVKGTNASPEYARVIPFGKCEKFAVNYKVQVPGTGEMVVLISDVFGLVEYDPSLLSGTLVDPADFYPLMEVVARTRAMADRHPAVKQAAPKFLKPLEDALNYRDQGMVSFRGRWMPMAEYTRMLAEEAQKEQKAREMGEAMERAQAAELKRREAEDRAMTEAANARVRDEERQRMRAEQERVEAKRRAAEEQMKLDRLAAETRQKAEAQRQLLESNLKALGTSRLGAVIVSEWETLVNWQNRQAGGLRSFSMERAALLVLKNQHFGKAGPALPAHFGSNAQATLHQDASGRSMMVLVSEGEGKVACLFAFDLPMNSQGIPASGEETKNLSVVLGDVSPDLLRRLPRSLSVSLASLPKSATISYRAPLEVDGSPGYLFITRPALAEDGQFHATLVVALGFESGAAPLASSLNKNP